MSDIIDLTGNFIDLTGNDVPLSGQGRIPMNSRQRNQDRRRLEQRERRKKRRISADIGFVKFVILKYWNRYYLCDLSVECVGNLYHIRLLKGDQHQCLHQCK